MFDRMRSEDGTVAVYFALLAPVLIGFAALATEVGFWLVTERKLQHIADVTAYSAATQAIGTTDPLTVKPAARERALSSGMRSSDSLSVENPPKLGTFKSNSAYWEATVERTVPRYLTAIFTEVDDPVKISARAVAGIVTVSGGPVCMLALSSAVNSTPAFRIGGAGGLTAENCGFASNYGFLIEGSGDVSGSCVYLGGGAFTPSPSNASELKLSCDRPEVLSRPVSDPYASQSMWGSVDIPANAAPTRSDEVVPDPSNPNKTKTITRYTPSKTNSLGVPIAKLNDVTFPNNDIFLEEGVYVVDGGTLKLTGNLTLTGKGVNFLLINGAKLDFSGNTVLDLSTQHEGTPPDWSDDNPYDRFLFISDRTSNSVEHVLTGNSGSELTGVVYFPTNNLTYTGDAGTIKPCIQVIAKEIKVWGSGAATINCGAETFPPDSLNIEVGERVTLVE